MNQHLQNILNTIEQDKNLSQEEKNAILKSLKDADKELEITAFKLDRTEKVKRTTAILLEETIEELEQKRKAVEAQNRELEIESALERVRTVALSMNRPDDMLEVCKTIALQLQLLGVKEIRNVQTAIFYRDRGTYMNYEYYAKHNKTIITETNYTNHEVPTAFAEQMFKGKGEVFTRHIKDKEVKDWLAYQRSTNVFIDTYLENASSLNYYWHSLGSVALGISTYVPLGDEELQLFQRFLKVFDLSYRRYLDIEIAIAQSREAQIEASLERVRAQALGMRMATDLAIICEVLYTELHTLGFAELRNTMVNIFDDDKGSFINYDYAAHAGKSINHLFYNTHPVIEKQVSQARSSVDAFSEAIFTGKDLADWKLFRKKGGEADDPKVDSVDTLFYYFYSIDTGVIGISTYSSITEEKRNILKRFRNVFDFAYRRYIDVALAEAQAHEAKIEASLERMRAVAMGLRKSEELVAICESMYKELTVLGFANIRNAQIAINNDARQAYIGFEYSNYSRMVMNEVAYNSYPMMSEVASEMKKSNSAFFQKEISGEEFENWRKWRKSFKEGDDPRIDKATSMCFYLFSIGAGLIGITTFNAITNNQAETLKRFRNVFELSYQRYTDVANAEAQAREAQIELALERVRARTMAMQKSDELAKTAYVLFQQFEQLGEDPEQLGIGIFNENENALELWTTINGKMRQKAVTVSLDEPIVMRKFYAAWKEEKKTLIIDISGKDLEQYNNYRKTLSTVELEPQRATGRRVISIAYFSKGAISLATSQPRPVETLQLLERFSNVFDLTYTRFLDLQKAEAQAKEAQIETALERVRARTMGMQKSDELKEVIQVVYDQFVHLNINTEHTGFVIDYKLRDDRLIWVASKHGVPSQLTIPYFDCEYYNSFNEAKEKGWDFFATNLSFEDKNSFYRELFKYIPELPEDAKEFYFSCPGLAISTVLLENVGLYIENFLGTPFTVEENATLMRFGKVFQQTYTRFIDLQKAEAQAKEAQIEAALEKVRSRTMAMQSSNELQETAAVLFREFKKLGAANVYQVTIGIYNEAEGLIDLRVTNWAGSGEQENRSFLLDMAEPTVLKPSVAAWKANKKSFVADLTGQALEGWINYRNKMSGVTISSKDSEGRRVISIAYFSKGHISISSPVPVPLETIKTLERFAAVFDGTYTRFLDLEKAEAQAREATIEAALEKVRGKAMAMHNSNDLSAAASMVFTELRKLGINPIRCGVGLLNKESRKAQLYSATSGEHEDSLSLVGWIMLTNHPVAEKIYDTWLKNEDYYPELSGEQLKSYYENLLSGLSLPSIPDWQGGQKQYGTFLPFSVGCLYAWSAAPYTEAEIKILKRFAAIIDLTFRRYIELQQSEANAREAVKQAALDRVRADIASMRTTNDLEKITPLIWSELTIIGIPFIRCGVFIMDENLQQIHTFLSTPDGKAIAAFHIPYSTPGNIQQVLKHWQQKGNYIDHWDESSFKEFADTLVKQGALTSSASYLQTIPQGGFYLHFLPFLQGMLYVGNSVQLKEEALELIQSVADAFSTAYARYEDFNKLEAAKQTVEKTLVDLKQAQTQLVQSEKMASLGELTAGIAHEIQNPLNFVNNFSEVSNELIDEMNAEIEKGDMEEAKAIANDIKQNLEKINHHGKRADAIVKGMLQHSRSSSATKEPTAINKLADEYLRLAYHGLRAKDKSFNATLKTDYDETLEKVNVIPQDIGRVILNLITNAFYAVSDRKKTADQRLATLYEPTVSVSTKKVNRNIEISVADNGNGIPKNIIDKIFQPFFTTKPTGQGTGLGLSLAYDIVKAHGGELKVETKEEEGTAFKILLPI